MSLTALKSKSRAPRTSLAACPLEARATLMTAGVGTVYAGSGVAYCSLLGTWCPITACPVPYSSVNFPSLTLVSTSRPCPGSSYICPCPGSSYICPCPGLTDIVPVRALLTLSLSGLYSQGQCPVRALLSRSVSLSGRNLGVWTPVWP